MKIIIKIYNVHKQQINNKVKKNIKIRKEIKNKNHVVKKLFIETKIKRNKSKHRFIKIVRPI